MTVLNKASDSTQMTGMFLFSGNRKLPGTLSLDGPNTTLHLWDESRFMTEDPHDETITGVLGDQKLVTLLGCITNNRSTKFGRGGTATHYLIFPHYVVIGDRLVSEDGADIENISYVFEDAHSLFHDMDSFQVDIGKPEQARAIIESLNPEKEIEVGELACIAYYTGKEEIFSSDTELGRITVRHSPTFDFGGPEGIHVDNRIIARIDFPVALNFEDALLRMYKSVSFFELMIGRVQNLKDISIVWKGDKLPIICDVYSSMYPRYEHSMTGFGTSFHDVLVDGARDSSSLSQVARAWIERDASWRTARSMLFSGWKEGRSYSADRLVRAANMYDLLPANCFPEVARVNCALALALRKAKAIFRKLPHGPDRDSVLGALGRVGTLTLKRKIRFRAQVVSPVLGEKVPNIERVADEAVNLRNRYVHGSETRVGYSDNPDLEVFLTDTLEFVFGVSDLVDAGWNMRDWMERGPHFHHPFGSYIESYLENWKELEVLLDGG